MLFPFPLPDVSSIVNNAAQSAQVETSASASGGNGSYSSVEVRNEVNSNTGGNTSSVQIYTDDNGEVHSETYNSSNGDNVDISTSTPNSHIEVHTSFNGSHTGGNTGATGSSSWSGSVKPPHWSEHAASSSNSTSTPQDAKVFEQGSLGASLVHKMFSFFGSIWGFFSR